MIFYCNSIKYIIFYTIFYITYKKCLQVQLQFDNLGKQIKLNLKKKEERFNYKKKRGKNGETFLKRERCMHKEK